MWIVASVMATAALLVAVGMLLASRRLEHKVLDRLTRELSSEAEIESRTLETLAAMREAIRSRYRQTRPAEWRRDEP